VHAGFSLAELLIVLVIAGVLLLLALPRLSAVLDGFAVRSAATELVAVFGTARQVAIQQRRRVAVVVDTAHGVVRVTGEQLVLERAVQSLYGVRLAATRDSMAYDARGLGYGAANLSIVAHRGRVAETLYVSRLGRVRR
jgi:prepilin-type N-terminal cleavage/methylation domain-containing protein